MLHSVFVIIFVSNFIKDQRKLIMNSPQETILLSPVKTGNKIGTRKKERVFK